MVQVLNQVGSWKEGSDVGERTSWSRIVSQTLSVKLRAAIPKGVRNSWMARKEEWWA